MSVIICATGPIDSGKTEFCNQLRAQEPSSIGFESSQLITEIANECNSYLLVEKRSSPAESHTEADYYQFFNNVLARIQENHPLLFEDDVRFTTSETIENPQQFESLRQYVADLLKYPEILEQRITVDNKETYRPFLKWLGGYMVYKAKPTVWFDEIGRRILRFQPIPKIITVNALRYPSDEQAMRQFAQNNGVECIVVEVQRPGTLEGTDVTEASRKAIHVDAIVVNNGSIDDLTKVARKFAHDLNKQRVQEEYHAK